jgi:hypothetical protein
VKALVTRKRRNVGRKTVGKSGKCKKKKSYCHQENLRRAYTDLPPLLPELLERGASSQT